MATEELTPMMRQYRRIKAELPEGVILMFRLGDFYEMFFEDAQIAAPILGLVQTHRAGSPMCGIPYHAIDTYLAKLIRAGKRAARNGDDSPCRQVGHCAYRPSAGKNITRHLHGDDRNDQ